MGQKRLVRNESDVSKDLGDDDKPDDNAEDSSEADEGKKTAMVSAAKGSASAKRGAAKGGSKGRGGAKECFVLTCKDVKKNSSKFCECHNKTVQNMQYQAKARDKKNQTGTQEVGAVADLMKDPTSAEDAIQEFRANNPDGVWGKTSTVDWCELNRAYKKENSTTHRDKEIATTKQDFIDDAKHKWDADQLKIEWGKLLDDPKIERT